MKNKKLILAAAIIVTILLTAGTLIAASEVIYFDTDGKTNPAEEVQAAKTNDAAKTKSTEEVLNSAEETPIQSYSQEIPTINNPGLQTPLIVLLVGFTVIIAGVNYRLNKE
ncbi:hypothetical protein LJC08_03260 [Methanimicrococcus sp. OttesenSCG-928-J09]|nr:hypothetical protein [Methanimicrococcus sp. OttesenSCG-928-J09]